VLKKLIRIYLAPVFILTLSLVWALDLDDKLAGRTTHYWVESEPYNQFFRISNVSIKYDIENGVIISKTEFNEVGKSYQEVWKYELAKCTFFDKHNWKCGQSSEMIDGSLEKFIYKYANTKAVSKIYWYYLKWMYT